MSGATQEFTDLLLKQRVISLDQLNEYCDEYLSAAHGAGRDQFKQVPMVVYPTPETRRLCIESAKGLMRNANSPGPLAVMEALLPTGRLGKAFLQQSLQNRRIHNRKYPH